MHTERFITFFRNRAAVAAVLFFAGLLVLGLVIFDDYGISSDEIVNRNNGLLAYRYVAEGDTELLSYRDRYYGTFFEVPLVLAEKILGFKDARSVFLMRHLATFLLYFAGVVCFYLLAARNFGSRLAGLAGAAMLVLSPRIFAHAFYNSKDIALMSVFIISMYTMVVFLDARTVSSAARHALSCAALVDIRVTGLVVPLLTVLFFLGGLWGLPGDERKKATGTLIAYMFLFAALTVLFWPVLWKDPAGGMISAVRQMSRFPWSGAVLYMGREVPATDLPWHYIPVWMLISTPLLYVAGFFAGTVSIAASFFRGFPGGRARARNGSIFLLMVLLPVAAVISTRAVLYDGWRHLFFVFPAFLMVSVTGMGSVYRAARSIPVKSLRKGATVFLAVFAGACLASTAAGMALMHPYQNVYFNAAAGGMSRAADHYDMDYWGLSYLEGLEYIAGSDDRETIRVYVASLPGRIGRIPALLLPPADSRRFVFTDSPREADYFMGNYRWHRGEYPYEDEVFSVEVRGAKIMSVYRLRQEGGGRGLGAGGGEEQAGG